ncbi:hypothetical protein C0J52_14181 [Blattella germanica]|nr:hypothetical protein C0J52_14181 [Blattella germanica]
MGHISVLLPELQSNHSSIPTDKNTGAWLASVHSIIMPLGCFLGGTFGDWYGRRLTLMLSTGLFLVGWLFIAGAQNHIMLFIGRIIDGASKGIAAAICEVLIDEFSERSIRASISASLGVAYAIGAAIIYGFGTTSDWRLGPGIAAILSFITLIALFFLPETAVWLVRKRRLSEARCSLKWSYGSAKEVQVSVEPYECIHRTPMHE